MKPWLPGRDPRAVRHLPPAPVGNPVPGAEPTVVVVGGGIAGLAAATGLAERGVRVHLVEAEASLGGRVRAWPLELPDGSAATMSRGFHAFFRQYYNLRALLRRADPTLAALHPVEDYPLQLGRDGKAPVVDSFTRVPRDFPWNLVGFVALSPSFGLGDLTRVDIGQALGLLRVRFPETYSELDGVSAAQLLDDLKFPESARHLALEVFARSFFADPREFSAGELIAMFHTYFIGSSEGLLFDVPRDDYDTALWAPLREYLVGLGVTVQTGVRALSVADHGGGIRVTTSAGEIDADAAVLALDTRALQQVLAASRFGDAAWRERVEALRCAPPFGVGRRWYAGRHSEIDAFRATSGYGPLDNISRLDAFEAGAERWSGRTGGSVIEVHGYALPDTSPALSERLWAEAARIHPELAADPVVAEQWLVEDDCPLIDTGSWLLRPTVRTPDPRLMLAGDLVRCDWPVALMERAATTGWQAANELLAGFGRRGHELWSPPLSGRLRR